MIENQTIVFVAEGKNFGGIERYIANLSQGFQNAGVQTEVVTLFDGFSFEQYLHEETKIVRLKANTFLTGFYRLYRYLLSRRSTPPSVTISSHEGVNLITGLCVSLIGLRTKYVPTIHFHLSTKLKYDRRFALRAIIKLSQIVFRNAFLVVTPSEHSREDAIDLLNLPSAKVKKIHYPAIPSSIFLYEPKDVPHEWFKLNVPVIVGCGRLTSQKNFKLLIQSFHHLQQELDARLVIVGEGPLRDELQHQIEELGVAEKVCLTGFTHDPLAYLFYADVFALSSLYEGFPFVTIEALAMGTPIVSTRCPSGPEELITSNEFGLLSDAYDPIVISGKLREACKMQFSKENLRSKARNFKVSNIVQEYRALLDL